MSNPINSTAATNPDGPTGRLSNWIHSVKLSDVPKDIQTRAKHLVLDGITCAFVGAHLAWSETATKVILNMEPKGDCAIIGWGSENKVSANAATVINSTFIQGFEVDDFNSASPLHNNALLLPALFAAVKVPNGKTTSYTGSQFLQSYIVGCEVGPRVGLALHGPDLLTRGWHSGTVMGPSSVAAAVSSLLSMPPNQIEDALGLACTQAGGLMSAQFGSMGKRMQHGFASRNGLVAAFLAQGGFTGIKQVYELSYGGFLDCFSQGTQFTPQNIPEELYKGLGEFWQLTNIKVKFHAAMAALHGPIDAVSLLQHQHPEKFTNVNDISGIDVQVGGPAYEHGGWVADPKEPLSSTGAQMSIQCAVATQLLDGQVLMDQFSEDKIVRPELRALMGRVKPIHDKSFDEGKENTFKTIVTITFDDGTTLSQTQQAPHFIQPGLSNEEIVEKWHKLVGGLPGMDQKRMKEIEEIVLNLDKSDSDITGLVALLEGVVGSPLQK